MAESPKCRPRRQCDDEFKAQAVRLVLEDGKMIPTVARDLDLTESALRHWSSGRAPIARRVGRTGLTAERDESARLRKENRELLTDRDILKKPRPLREAPGVKFAWIAAEKACFRISDLCRNLGVSMSGYYACVSLFGLVPVCGKAASRR
jgi:transposase